MRLTERTRWLTIATMANLASEYLLAFLEDAPIEPRSAKSVSELWGALTEVDNWTFRSRGVFSTYEGLAFIDHLWPTPERLKVIRLCNEVIAFGDKSAARRLVIYFGILCDRALWNFERGYSPQPSVEDLRALRALAGAPQ